MNMYRSAGEYGVKLWTRTVKVKCMYLGWEGPYKGLRREPEPDGTRAFSNGYQVGSEKSPHKSLNHESSS